MMKTRRLGFVESNGDDDGKRIDAITHRGLVARYVSYVSVNDCNFRLF